MEQFWADRGELALGAVFKPRAPAQPLGSLKRPLPDAQFEAGVEQGFQASATWHQGAIMRAEAGAGGELPSTVDSCRWAFSVQPVVGWGDAGARQKATAGWLAALPVFEPHWQVVMAHGLASGSIEWGGRRYDFKDAPFYAVSVWVGAWGGVVGGWVGGCLGQRCCGRAHKFIDAAMYGVGGAEQWWLGMWVEGRTICGIGNY